MLEAGFFLCKLCGYLFLIFLEFGIHMAISFYNGPGNLGKAVFRYAYLHCEAYRAADKAAQNIALVHVGRGNAPWVAQYKGCAPYMIRNYAEGLLCGFVVIIILAAQLRNAGNYGGEAIGIVYAFRALKGCNGPVEAHAGIHIALGKRGHVAFGVLIILHENVVPYFKVLAAVAGRVALRATLGLAGIEENLRIRAAGAGVAGYPPVMLCAKIEYMAGVNAHFHPTIVRFGISRGIFVALEAGEIQPVLIYAQPFFAGEQFIAPRY